MKQRRRIWIFSTLLVIGLASISMQLQRDKRTDRPGPRMKLSEYGFFIGPLHQLQPVAGVIPYDLNSSLFSNYAEKARFMRLPEGTPANFHATDDFDLPVGTVLIKNFYYPLDFRHPDKGRRILETRLLIHETEGWEAYPYIWNDEQTDADFEPAGDGRDVSYTDAKGKKVKFRYIIPNYNQCKGCHSENGQFTPIGIAARHLNREYGFAEGRKNQLLYWKEKGLLQGLPEDFSTVEQNADWQDRTASLDKRARAYLDINCAHCHNPKGPANTSGLLLHAQNTDATTLGIRKSPVAAGRGSGDRLYDIVPGKPQESILLYRMQSVDPGIAMPELGREQLHPEGIALITDWIRSLGN